MSNRSRHDKADNFLQVWKLLSPDYPLPQDEYNFDKEINRRHRFDFAWPTYKIAVEVEGNAWGVAGGGKHMQDSDLEKYNIAVYMGWRVFRFSPGMLKRDPIGCVDMITKIMEIK